MNRSTSKIGSLSSNLATFLYMIHDKGCKIHDPILLELCQKIDSESQKPSLDLTVQQILELLPKAANQDPTNLKSFLSGEFESGTFQEFDIFDLAKEFMDAIEASLAPDASFKEVATWLENRVPEIKQGFPGKARGQKLHAIRQYEFQQSLPWLAQIAERTEDGLISQWVMVEKITDIVHCMDPNPWDDIEEDFEFSINDFMVRWELCDSVALHL